MPCTGQVRALWAEAMANGLYDGWDAGQSAYGHAPPIGGAKSAPPNPPGGDG